MELLEKVQICGSNVLADRAYGARTIREYISEHGASYVIPPQSNVSEPWPVDWYLYKERHLVECFFQKIKWFRRIATRYDKLDASFLAFVYVEFTTGSFSPFVLVYEEEDNDRPTRPDPDPDDDRDDEDEEEAPVDDGLNREDHYAYIAGYEDGTVRPDGNITRAEVATIFFRLMTDEYRETCWSTSSGFTDVAVGNWYNNAISTTANAGWVSGYPDGTFRPDAYITRAEFATIAARFLSDVYGGTSMFTDISGHWAEDYINRAAAAGWINGYADGTFRPNAYITRAEAVTLINRMLDRAPDANHLLADMVRWPDNPETAWYYADIQEATNSHDYTRAGTGNYEVWTELLANRDWAALEEIWSQANDAPGGEVADGLTPNGN